MTLKDFIDTATRVVLSLTPWILLLVLFFWLSANIIWSSGNAEKRKEIGQRLIWALVALVVIFSVGGIIAVLSQTFFGGSSLQYP